MRLPLKAIVGFGASSMQGVGDSMGGFFKRLASHPSLEGCPLTWHNHGVGGNTLKDMLDRADRAKPACAYDLVVLLGCNDLPRNGDSQPGRRSSLETYRTRVKELLLRLRGHRSLFLTSFSVSEEATGIARSDFEAYMAAARDVALSQNYELWDLYRETARGCPHFLAPDGLHFNADGHAWLADRIVPWIRSGFSPAR